MIYYFRFKYEIVGILFYLKCTFKCNVLRLIVVLFWYVDYVKLKQNVSIYFDIKANNNNDNKQNKNKGRRKN